MRWNGRGELVCPLRGQSLESRLAAQRSVVRIEGRTGRSLYLHPPRSRKPILATKLKRTSMEGVGQALQQGRPSIGDCSSIFQHHVDGCSTVPSPSAPSWLDFSDQTPGSGLHHRDFEPWWCTPAQQRIGTDEVHADGAGPSPLNSVLSRQSGSRGRHNRWLNLE